MEARTEAARGKAEARAVRSGWKRTGRTKREEKKREEKRRERREESQQPK